MFEKSIIAFLKAHFGNTPVYAFIIPEDAPPYAVCFENAGRGVLTNSGFGEEIARRAIKVTVSSDDVTRIFEDEAFTKYIHRATTVGQLPILNAKITGVVDNFSQAQRLYERTYTITITIKERLI
ncbi:hypothetical protein [Edwardsiella tarda]|uniref:hypothetical protein n=1 Tax=Edwardsiella tarda TaxID=636 RepID=UPI00083A7FC1|nr:hypothetical protein [Edwardsiella tarda]